MVSNDCINVERRRIPAYSIIPIQTAKVLLIAFYTERNGCEFAGFNFFTVCDSLCGVYKVSLSFFCCLSIVDTCVICIVSHFQFHPTKANFAIGYV